MNTNSRMKAVMSEPLFAGDSSPSSAKDRVAKHMQNSCTPVPTNTLTPTDNVRSYPNSHNLIYSSTNLT